MPKVIQPRTFNPRKSLFVLAVLAVAFFVFQRPPPPITWSFAGTTMGTEYSIKVFTGSLDSSGATALKTDIDKLLVEVNRQMSTYIPDSEISSFNRSVDTNFQFVSQGFAVVTSNAIALCVETGGAFNPALDHLINAWGFGHEGPRKEPSADELARALALSGCDRIEVAPGSRIRKLDPDVHLNLNAIAKGWGSDEVARLLARQGLTNFMVEIGGEVVARGMSEQGRSWRIGIDRPVDGALPGEAYDLVVALDGKALATSGNYRNFVVNEAGEKVSHIFDPRTGRPAQSSLASVSVIAPDCATADALATGLFVMGTEEAVKWVDARPDVEAAFIDYQPDGSLKTTFSRNFEAYLIK